jgi:hypothetical protein
MVVSSGHECIHLYEPYTSKKDAFRNLKSWHWLCTEAENFGACSDGWDSTNSKGQSPLRPLLHRSAQPVS